MSEQFDAYYKWLGIPPDEQPPNFYRLLGVKEFESDPDVIESAADQRMSHLRTFQTGQRSRLSEKLLNEVSAARVSLLNPDKKAEYDDELKRELAVGEDDPLGASLDQPSGGTALPEPAGFESRPAIIPAGPKVSTKLTAKKKPAWMLPVAISVGLLVILGVLVVVIIAGSKEDEETQSVAEQNIEQPSTDSSGASGPSKPASRSAQDVLPADQSTDSGAADRQVDEDNNNQDTSSPFKVIDDRGAETEMLTQDAAGPDKTTTDPIEKTTEPVEPTSPIDEEIPKKYPVPNDDEQKPVLATLEAVFNFSETRTPKQNLELASELFELAKKSQDPIERFVLLRGMLKYAGGGGDAQLVLNAVNEIDRHFQIDRFEIGQNALVGFAGQAGSKEAISSLTEATVQFIEEAISAGRIEVAKDLTDAVYREIVTKPDATEFRKRIYDERERVQALSAQWKDIQDARAHLKENPDDPNANLVVGRWYCFELGDCETGLPMLAKGSDAELKELAKKDLSAPETPSEQVALADAWWNQAKSSEGRSKEKVKLRAAHWYRQSLPALAGLDKAKAEERLAEVKTDPRDVPEPNLLDEAILVLTFEPDTFLREGDSVVVKDLSGRGNNGTVNGASLVEGKAGRALVFDGKDDFVLLPTLREELIQDTKSLTIATWVFPRSTSRNYMIFDVGEKSGTGGSVTLSQNRSEQPPKLAFTVATQGHHVPMSLLPAWHHLVITWNGKESRLYYNGELLDRQDLPIINLDSATVWEPAARLGSQAKRNYREKRFFDGVIDEFVMLRRVLSADEVKALYQLGLRGKTLAQ